MPPCLARLGIDDFFALERGLQHSWLLNGESPTRPCGG